MRVVTIIIDRTEQIKRFEQATWKMGRSVEQGQNTRHVYNLEADTEEPADNGLANASFETWLHEGMRLISEYIAESPEPSYGMGSESNKFRIVLNLPQHWLIHSAPGLKYAMQELIHNGMMADWCEDIRPEAANTYLRNAELNKAQITSIIYALNAP